MTIIMYVDDILIIVLFSIMACSSRGESRQAQHSWALSLNISEDAWS